MTIQPLSSRPREISVTEVVEPAYERVKAMLFRPFDLTKWIVIGFCAWLAGLGESGGSGFGGFNGGAPHNQANPGDELRHAYHEASNYVLANLGWIVPLAAFLLVLGLVIWLVVLWLNSRGKFMFLHCVALDKAEVDVPWREYAREANSLFLFRIALSVGAAILILTPVGFIVVDIMRMVMQGEPDAPGIMLAAGLGMILLFLFLICALIHKFLADFVVPIMYLRKTRCLAACREFWSLLSGNPWKFVLYILFQIVLWIVIGALVVAVIFITCCIAGCFLALPFIGTVLLLPIHIFKRSYSLYYLAQYGAEYDVFPNLPAAPQTPTPPSNAPLAPV